MLTQINECSKYLDLFVQHNFTGPKLDAQSVDFTESLFNDSSTNIFTGDNVLHSSVELTRILVFVAEVLDQASCDMKSSLTYNEVDLKFVDVLRRVTRMKSPAVFERFSSCLKRFPFNRIPNERSAAETHAQIALISLDFFDFDCAVKHFQLARESLGLNVDLTGALGKRTRFQVSETAQLAVTVSRTKAPVAYAGNSDTQKPTAYSLGDDTVYDTIQFTGDGIEQSLSDLDLAILYATGIERRKTMVAERAIMNEEQLAFISRVVATATDWSLLSWALFDRSRLEQDSPRRIERSLKQLEELISQTESSVPDASTRLRLFYCTSAPPRWTVQTQLATLLINAGLKKEALDLYRGLGLWEEAVSCLLAFGRTGEAEQVVRDQIARQGHETVETLCALGDVLDLAGFYEQAWDLSGNRSSRAQKSLGLLYVRQKELERSLPCFAESVRLNPLQVGLWFTYGCAALGCQQYDVAAKAFHRNVTLEADNFEGWSNLATAYIRTGQKTRAFSTLQEAIKCSFENYRLWENLILVGIDIGNFGEVMHAIDTLLSFGRKYSDSEVLSILVRAITTGMSQANGQPAAELKGQALKLFARLHSSCTMDALFFRSYSALLEFEQDDIEKFIKSIDLLLKAHSKEVEGTVKCWQTDDLDGCVLFMQHAVDFAQSIQERVSLISDNKSLSSAHTETLIRFCSSCRLTLLATQSRLKKSPLAGDARLAATATQLQSELSSIDDKLAVLRKAALSSLDRFIYSALVDTGPGP